MPNRNDKILLLETTRFKCITESFVVLANELLKAGEEGGFVPWITGASYEQYPTGGYHDLGYAWDIRIHNVKDPLRFACALRTNLYAISDRFRVVYGNKDHTDHIHVEYRFDGKPRPEEA